LRRHLEVAATLGRSLWELGESTTAEELAWWSVMIEQDWLGPIRQARLLAHIAAGVRNGPLKGPSGDGSLWTADEFIAKDRWNPPKRWSLADMKRAIRSAFTKKFSSGVKKKKR
jgi:hypothetical protein